MLVKWRSEAAGKRVQWSNRDRKMENRDSAMRGMYECSKDCCFLSTFKHLKKNVRMVSKGDTLILIQIKT